jgi:hypothetical protein
MNRFELLRQLHGAALLLKDARKKVEQANRYLRFPVRKPLATAIFSHPQRTVTSGMIGRIGRSA